MSTLKTFCGKDFRASDGLISSSQYLSVALCFGCFPVFLYLKPLFLCSCWNKSLQICQDRFLHLIASNLFDLSSLRSLYKDVFHFVLIFVMAFRKFDLSFLSFLFAFLFISLQHLTVCRSCCFLSWIGNSFPCSCLYNQLYSNIC